MNETRYFEHNARGTWNWKFRAENSKCEHNFSEKFASHRHLLERNAAERARENTLVWQFSSFSNKIIGCRRRACKRFSVLAKDRAYANVCVCVRARARKGEREQNSRCNVNKTQLIFFFIRFTHWQVCCYFAQRQTLTYSHGCMCMQAFHTQYTVYVIVTLSLARLLMQASFRSTKPGVWETSRLYRNLRD